MNERCKWFALLGNGDIVYLGEHTSFEAAEDMAERVSTTDGVVWTIDEEGAREWMSTLQTHLR